MNTSTLPQDQLLPTRIALWGSLITVHTVFLAAAFAVVLSTQSKPSLMIDYMASFALVGATLPLLCLASSVAQLLEQATPNKPNSKITLLWSKSRPKLWAFAETGSTISLLGCAVLLFFAIIRAGS